MLRPRHLIALSFLLAFLSFPLFRPNQIGTTSLRRITNTSEEALSLNPSLSGNGEVAAFESTADPLAEGRTGFHALRADVTTEPVAIRQAALSRAVAPAISQDGSRIAFASKDDPLETNHDGNSEIYLYDGGSLSQITDTSPGDLASRVTNGNFQPSISDDGRVIAFSSNRDLTNQNPDGNLEIFLFDTVAFSFSQLTNSIGMVGCSDAKISGDATRVAYVRDRRTTSSTQRDLVIQEVFPFSTVKIIGADIPSLKLAYGRAISDDGARVVYSSETADHSTQVFLFDRRWNATRQMMSLGARPDDVPLQATISGDGSRVAFATRRDVLGGNADHSVELYTFDIPTAQFSRVTTAPSTATAEVVSSLNDDGSLIAFNFPRVLSGPVTETNLANNSEIYLATTAIRPAFGNLTVVNGASFGNEPVPVKALAPASIAVAQGNALADLTQQAQRQSDGTFPLTLGGTTMTMNGRPTQILYASPTQVNFIVPADTEISTAEVLIANADGYRSRGAVSVLRAAPGVFTTSGDGRGEGVVLNADTLQTGPFDPTGGNLRLAIFTTGVRGASEVVVSAGGRALNVEAVAASADFAGMDEVHVLVPADLRGSGSVDLIVRADSRDSNAVRITFTGDSSRNIAINELLADPPDGILGDANHDGVRSSADDEFVELINAEGAASNISGWTVRTRAISGTNEIIRHRFAANTLLLPGEPIVVFGGGIPGAHDPVFGCARVETASSGSLSLTNSGLHLVIRDASGNLATQLSYGGTTGLDGDNNQSLTRSPDTQGSLVQHNAADGANGRRFSAGTKVDGTPFGNCPGHLTSLTLAPLSASITVGQSTRFTAQALDEYARPLTTAGITFSSDNAAVGNVESVIQDPLTGITTATVSGSDQGGAHITAQATSGEITLNSIPAVLTVAPLVTRVQVSPAAAAINRGNSKQFTATAFDQNNQPLSGIAFTWTSSDVAIATIDSRGLARGAGIGSVTIAASTNSRTGTTVSGTAMLTVQVPLVINEVLAQVPLDNSATLAIEGDANRDGVRSSDDDEFVELLNSSNASVDVSGVIISDSTSHRFTFAPNTVLAPGRSVVVFGGGSPLSNEPAFGGALIFTTGSLGLGDNGDLVRVTLPAATGEVQIDSLVYGPGNPIAAPGAQSLTRFPDAEIGSADGNFIPHVTAPNASGRVFSPGTRLHGTPFGSLAITRIAVSPGTAAIDIGLSQSFTAQAFSNVGGLEILLFNVAFIWDSSAPAKATFAPTTGQTTNATAIAAGEATIRARAGESAGEGFLTINPPLPTLSINDVAMNEGNSGTTTFAFTVSLSAPAPAGGVAFNVETEDNTATVADHDYLARGLTGQTIPAGSQSSSFAVTVIGDLAIEANETFFVNVSGLSGAFLGDGHGVGTIQNDDAPQLVITQLYGGGNNSGATFQNDFVEIFNPGASAVNLATTPYSVQYASAAGNFTAANKLDLMSGVLLPGQYFLIKLAGGTTNGAPLPAADATQTSINMSATDGKVALVNGTGLLLGNGCPFGASVADFVGYGSANCAEGGATPALSATKSALRINSCSDTNSNSADFAVLINPAAPHNSATTPVPCSVNALAAMFLSSENQTTKHINTISDLLK
ncbi:MAG: lamin tail domain-containing protein [Acidobacteriota bacterium]